MQASKLIACCFRSKIKAVSGPQVLCRTQRNTQQHIQCGETWRQERAQSVAQTLHTPLAQCGQSRIKAKSNKGRSAYHSCWRQQRLHCARCAAGRWSQRLQHGQPSSGHCGAAPSPPAPLPGPCCLSDMLVLPADIATQSCLSSRLALRADRHCHSICDKIGPCCLSGMLVLPADRHCHSRCEQDNALLPVRYACVAYRQTLPLKLWQDSARLPNRYAWVAYQVCLGCLQTFPHTKIANTQKESLPPVVPELVWALCIATQGMITGQH